MKTVSKIVAVMAGCAGLVLGGGVAYAAPPTTTWTVSCIANGTSPTVSYLGEVRYLTRNVTSLRSGGGANFEWTRYGIVGPGRYTVNDYPNNMCAGGNWTKTIWQGS